MSPCLQTIRTLDGHARDVEAHRHAKWCPPLQPKIPLVATITAVLALVLLGLCPSRSLFYLNRVEPNMDFERLTAPL